MTAPRRREDISGATAAIGQIAETSERALRRYVGVRVLHAASRRMPPVRGDARVTAGS